MPYPKAVPRYDVKCNKCSKKTDQFHGMEEGHDPCKCGGKNETVFDRVTPMFDGVGPTWPRRDWAAKPVQMPDGSFRDRSFKNRKEQRAYYHKIGKEMASPT